MTTATINGTTLWYDEAGSTGPLCLVLHGGLGLDQSLYREFDRLGDRLRVVRYDHRGNGLVLTVEPPLRIPTGAQFQKEARAWLDQRKGRATRESTVKALQQRPTAVEERAAFFRGGNAHTEKRRRLVAND